MGPEPDAAVAALTEQQEELADLLSRLGDAEWEQPSRCEGWSVADVVLHLAQTDEMAVASVRGTFGEIVGALSAGGEPGTVDDGAGLLVARDRGQRPPAVRGRWQAGAAALREALDGCDLHRRVTWVAGELSVRTLVTTRLAETWIHTGDVGLPLGLDPAPTGRLWHVARLAWRTLPYAFARAGRARPAPVAFELRGPGGHAWDFVPDAEPLTTVRGDAVDLCLLAARRVAPGDTGLRAEGPDASAVLELVRTYA